MTYKKTILFWFFIVIFFLLIIGVFNFIVDPYQQYRKAVIYPMLFKKNQRYINPGLAKNYDYDSVIIGSSMTENFIISNVEEILSFDNAIKFCISGGTAYEDYRTLKTAYKHQNIYKILYGLDIYAFMGEPDRLRHGKILPFFLYDEILLNDYQYLLNIDIAVSALRALVNPYRDNNNLLYNYDYMWQWQHEFEDAFGEQKVLQKWLSSKGSNKKFEKDLWSFDKLANSFDKNLLSLIRDHPETEFVLFYPPYSILTFHDWHKEGVLESSIEFKRYVFKKIKQYSNVQLYDFQVAENIILNLDNYRDYSHYHQNINTWMLGEVKNNDYRVTDENIDIYSEKLLYITQNYVIPKI